MPKIKGWSKVRSKKYNIEYASDTLGRRLKIYKFTNPYGKYTVELMSTNGKTNWYKRFKTKKKALKFAKNWLKKHPE